MMYSDGDAVVQLARAAEGLCHVNVVDQPPPTNQSGVYCHPLWDGWGCWNYTLAGHTAIADCPGFVDGFDSNRQAHRYCTEIGEWWRAPNNKTWANYTTCIDISAIEEGKRVITVFIAGYSISTVFLSIALFIFFNFKQLRCARVTLHKNLFTSYILNSIVWILYYTLAAQNPVVLKNNPIWCRIIHVITQYFVTCNFFWMFCEGLYLHTIIVVAFTSGKKLLLGCFFIGWGVPLIPATIYTIVRALNQQASTRCWIDPSYLTWIIFGPIVATLIVNVLFICNIIRVLITKIRAVNSPSSTQHRKAVRAALILIPLLGIQFILFPFEPQGGTIGYHVFQLTSAFVVAFQGLFVALIFCFFNGEVVAVLRRRWGQHQLMRSGSMVSKHRDSMFFNHTQATVVLDNSPEDSPSNVGCIKSNKTANSIKKLNPFKTRSKSCDSATNGLMAAVDGSKTEENHVMLKKDISDDCFKSDTNGDKVISMNVVSNHAGDGKQSVRANSDSAVGPRVTFEDSKSEH